MAYVPNPADPTTPLDTDPASSAAEEFRTLKAYIALTQKYLVSKVTAPIALASGVQQNVTHLDLPVGTWDVEGQFVYSACTGSVFGWLGLVYDPLVAIDPVDGGYTNLRVLEPNNGFNAVFPTGRKRFVCAAPTTVQLSAGASFTGAMSVSGMIQAYGALP